MRRAALVLGGTRSHLAFEAMTDIQLAQHVDEVVDAAKIFLNC